MNLITSREACSLLCISRSTLYRWVERGLVPVYILPTGIRRYDRDSLLKLLPDCRQEVKKERSEREVECLMFLRNVGVLK